MSLLEAAEQAAAHEACRQVCSDGATFGHALARTDTHRVEAFCIEVGRHPSGQRDIATPVVVAWHAEHWLRLAIWSKGLDR